MSEQMFIEQVEEVRRQFSTGDVRTLPALRHLANWYLSTRQPQAAQPVMQEIYELLVKACGPRHFQVAGALSQLAVIECLGGKYKLAEDQLRHAIDILNAPSITRPRQLANTLNQLAELLFEKNRHQEAIETCQQALKLLKLNSPEDRAESIRTLNNLGALHVATGKLLLAQRLFSGNLRLCKQVYGKGDPALAVHYNNLAEVYRQRGRYDEARFSGEKALALWTKAYGQTHPLVARGLTQLAAVFLDRKDYPKVEALQREALRIHRALCHPKHPHIKAALHALEDVLRLQNKHEDIAQLHADNQPGTQPVPVVPSLEFKTAKTQSLATPKPIPRKPVTADWGMDPASVHSDWPVNPDSRTPSRILRELMTP